MSSISTEVPTISCVSVVLNDWIPRQSHLVLLGSFLLFVSLGERTKESQKGNNEKINKATQRLGGRPCCCCCCCCCCCGCGCCWCGGGCCLWDWSSISASAAADKNSWRRSKAANEPLHRSSTNLNHPPIPPPFCLIVPLNLASTE